MNIISMHSHKGGVGKSTFGLFFAKYLAHLKQEKTCLIDLDFQAQGLRSIYLRKYLKYDFSDLLLADDENKKMEILKDIVIKHEEIENLYFIANYFKPHLENHKQDETRRKMYIKLANEIYTGEITDNINQLVRYSEKEEFKNIIIDCHPGLVLLSEEIIKEVRTTPIFITTANIISFIGMFQNLLFKADDWKLTLPGLNIIINRVPEHFVLEEALNRFLEFEEITRDEEVVCKAVKEKLINQKNTSMRLIKESEQIRDMESLINFKTLLSMDIPDELANVVERLYQAL